MGRASWTILKSRLPTILANIDSAVWSIDADTYETLYLNPAAERIYGRTASAFYADPKLFMNIVHPEDRPRVTQMLPELIEKGTMTIQYRVVRPDGEVRWLQDATTVARDEDGRLVRFDGVARNIPPEWLEFEFALKRAMERTEFVLHYQPQTRVKTSQVVAVEALVRWRHPTHGLMPASQFIGVAEETGLIVPIGAWALRAACAQNKAWQDAGLPHLRMGVNISAKQFLEGQIVHTVRQVLEETDLPPSDLELEITENVFLRDIEVTVRTLSELRSMGVAIGLGTGFSSLNYLRRLPIDKLKIDGSFIRDLSADPNAAVVLSQVIQLGHAMQLEVVAEGVETENEYAFLAGNHCDLVQGYYLHKPLSSAELGQLLKQRLQ